MDMLSISFTGSNRSITQIRKKGIEAREIPRNGLREIPRNGLREIPRNGLREIPRNGLRV